MWFKWFNLDSYKGRTIRKLMRGWGAAKYKKNLHVREIKWLKIHAHQLNLKNIHAMAWKKFIQGFDKEKKFLQLENSSPFPPPPPTQHNFFNGPSLRKMIPEDWTSCFLQLFCLHLYPGHMCFLFLPTGQSCQTFCDRWKIKYHIFGLTICFRSFQQSKLKIYTILKNQNYERGEPWLHVNEHP